MRFCLWCNIEITRKLYGKDKGKYCSRSCSVRARNQARGVRSGNVWGKCIGCGARVSTHKANILCKGCKPHVNKLADKTLSELRSEFNLNQYHAKIRGNARAVYFASGKSMSCKVCSYDLHVDICHVIAVHQFNADRTLGEVNNIDNLVALCKNHHWEFDNGMLDLRDEKVS